MDVVRRAQLGSLIETLPAGLDTVVGDRGLKLSGGERQRLSIARAMLQAAPLLILDEATSALDSTTEKEIQAAINEALVGRTALVIAHRLSTIRHADKIIVLEAGRVQEEGDLESLLKREGRFQQLWTDQQFY